jgi:hypothetical protein
VPRNLAGQGISNPGQASMCRRGLSYRDQPDLPSRCYDGLSIISVVCTENLDPGVVMMKSAEYRVRTDDSSALNRARDRRIFIQ